MSFFRNIKGELYTNFILIAVLCTVLFISNNLYVLSALSIGLFVYMFLVLLDKLGKEIPIKEVLMVMFIIQMLIMPIVTYHFFDGEVILLKMWVTEEEYMQYAFWGVLLFMIGLNKKTNFVPDFSKDETNNSKLGVAFVIVGLIGDIGDLANISGLGFAFFILKSFKFAGSYFLLFSNYKYRYYFIAFVYLSFAIKIIKGGIFYELIIWSLFFYIFYSFKRKTSFFTNLSLVTGALLFLFVLQIVKTKYRAFLIENLDTDKIALFSNMFEEHISDTEHLFQDNYIEAFVGRLNTGWVVGKVMEHIPLRENFSNGEKLITDVLSSFVPRIIYPNKRTIAGEEYRKFFLKYTGKQLSEKTTVNIGMLGDMYINFGIFGGIIALFFIGKLISWFYHYFYDKGGAYILLLPVLFFNPIRMNELFVILNSSIKVIIMVLLIKYALKRIYNIGFTSSK